MLHRACHRGATPLRRGGTSGRKPGIHGGCSANTCRRKKLRISQRLTSHFGDFCFISAERAERDARRDAAAKWA